MRSKQKILKPRKRRLKRRQLKLLLKLNLLSLLNQHLKATHQKLKMPNH
ncbi:hypothetical protein [Macrococcoides canis]|nr:hypothetical protein [Macrococcus canis]